ncbi:MAG: SAM-dependent methyltransferase [Burkholderiaceae bacterium]
MPAQLPLPSPEAAAHSARVLAALRDAAARGFLPFSDYMRIALYAPGLGYYAAGAQKFGAAGDFVTAPELSPFFARALARQVAQVMRASSAQVIEFGAGSGALAAELIPVLDALGVAPASYAILEVSPDLRARQQERLGVYGDRVRWLDSLPAEFSGCLIANEILDAMPVSVFEKCAGGVVERGLVLREAAIEWESRPAPAALLEAVGAIEAELGPLPEGYVSEVNLAGVAWLKSIAAILKQGALIAIDYGFPRAEYYHPQRAAGTLTCHYRHHSHHDPLWLPGLCDITAHVDFTAMADAALTAGLDVLGYTSQAHFLLNCGLADLLVEATPAERNAAHKLLSEAEMGELFKVLMVGRDLGDTPLGFVAGDRRGRL